MAVETDEQIARAVQAGQAERFGELIERYQGKLLRYAKKFILDPDDADDIVQDVFIKVYQNINGFDASRRFSPWVYRIAHNEFVNEIKRRYSRGIMPVFDFDTMFPHLTAPDTADSAALERDLRAALETHLADLDPKYREPLVLYYLEEMSYNEISDIMQIPVSTVGVRLARARKLLQEAAAGDPALQQP